MKSLQEKNKNKLSIINTEARCVIIFCNSITDVLIIIGWIILAHLWKVTSPWMSLDSMKMGLKQGKTSHRIYGWASPFSIVYIQIPMLFQPKLPQTGKGFCPFSFYLVRI